MSRGDMDSSIQLPIFISGIQTGRVAKQVEATKKDRSSSTLRRAGTNLDENLSSKIIESQKNILPTKLGKNNGKIIIDW